MEQKGFLSYTIIDAFTADPSFVQLGKTITTSNDISSNLWNFYTDISNNIHNPDPNDILDLSGNMKNETTVVDIARQDAQLLLIQQNSIYMIGTITIATLLITAILLSK